MRYMNEWDIDQVLSLTEQQNLPNLHRGAVVLSKLRHWANNNSDGWPYWTKPALAAKKLMAMLDNRELFLGRGTDVPWSEVNKAFIPIKALLTRQGADHKEVFDA